MRPSVATLVCFAGLTTTGACGRSGLDDGNVSSVNETGGAGGAGNSGGAMGSGGATGAMGAGGATGDGGASARVPSQHRATAACPVLEGNTACREYLGSPPGETGCALDSDCRAKPSGRCEISTSSDGCACVYDDCASDADCAGEICACNPDWIGNHCVPGTCHVDADCGRDGFCGPVEPPCNGDQIVTFQCHAATDACLVDSDCRTNEREVCQAWSAAEGWVCKSPLVTCPAE